MPINRNKANKSNKTGDTLLISPESTSILEATENLYFERQTWDQLMDPNRDIASILAEQSPLEDKVRDFLGAFYTSARSPQPNNGDFPLDTRRVAPFLELFPGALTPAFLHERRSGEFPHIEGTDADGHFVQETFTIRFRDDAQLPNGGGYSDYIFGFINPLTTIDMFVLSDFTTSVNIYEEGSNREEESHGLLNMYAEIKSEYNFHQKKYEKVMTEESIEEIALPNIYNFLLSDQRDFVPKAILGQRGRISVNPEHRLSRGAEIAKRRFRPVSNYYDQWAQNWKEWTQDNFFQRLNDKMKTIYFTKKETEQFPDLYKYREQFPMFTTVEFTTEPDALLGTILEETNFSTKMMDFVKSPPDNARRAVKTNNFRTKYAPPPIARLGRATGRNTTNVVAEQQNASYYSVDEFFKKRADHELEDTIYFNEEVVNNSSAFYTLMALIVQSRVNKIKKEKFRSYLEILDGVTAYSEPVLYVVEKHYERPAPGQPEDRPAGAGGLGGPQPSQTFYFTNTEKLDVLRFVDTQVKYDTRYTYQIKSLNLVIGTKYKYTEQERTPQHNVPQDPLKITVESRPHIMLVETVLFEKSVRLLDSPPVAPNVTFVPLRGVSDKMKILMNMGVDKYMATPINFSEEEGALVSAYKIAQDIAEWEEEIMFATDDTVEEFVIYRMDTEPRNYADFESLAEKMYVKTGSTRINASVEDKQRTSSASLVDNIVPNITYYYCIRAIDIHGHISYPTVPYTVELVEDAGSIYPLIDVYEFKGPPKVTQPSRSAKRFISISPSARNLFVNEDDMGIDGPEDGPELGDEVSLGVSPDPTWDKNFKMRLTSKMTGRKVDVNFRFTHRPGIDQEG